MDANMRSDTPASMLPLVSFSPEETILSVLPFFSLDYGHQRRQYRISYETQLAAPDVEATLQWQVSADPVYGYPDAFDRKVFKMVEHLALEQGLPVQNPIRFSLRQLLQLLGMAPFASHLARVRSSLRRIAAVTLQSRLIYTSGRRRGKGTQTFHLYDTVSFQDAAAGDEVVTDSHWIAFGAWYLQTLNRNPAPQLDLHYFREIRDPLASRLYELLTVKFGEVIRRDISGWRIAYPTLCRLLPLRQTLGAPQKQLEGAHRQLIATGFLEDVVWEKHEKDWMILYTPGRRVQAMYEHLPGQEKRLIHAKPPTIGRAEGHTVSDQASSDLTPGLDPVERNDGLLSHWHLKESPFDTTPNPAFYFETPQCKTGLFTMHQAVSTQVGAMLLTGDPGCGKTLLTRTFIHSLHSGTCDIALLTNPRWNGIELLREILYQFGHSVESADKTVILRKIEAHWYDACRNGRHTVVIIDEAQLIKDQDAFEELRLLLNFQMDDRYLATLILVGQPELRDQIRAMPAFEQRLAYQHHLTALSAPETDAYIRHRLHLSGAGKDIFTAEAIGRIHRLSEGVPRRINTLCNRALLAGWVDGRHGIDDGIVEQTALSTEYGVRSTESFQSDNTGYP